MPKVRASSATIGTMRGPSAGSFSRLPSMRTKAIVVRHLLAVGLRARTAAYASSGGHRAAAAQSLRRAGSVAAERRAPLVQVAHLGAVVGGLVEGAATATCVVGQRQREAVAEGDAAPSLSSFFCWCVVMRPCAAVAHAVALLGLGEDRRSAGRVCARAAAKAAWSLTEVVAAAAAGGRSRSSRHVARPARAAPGSGRRSARG